jgi:tRNA(Ile)-lysidine synthase
VSLCVALSGGIDSTALFVALAQVCRDVPGAYTLRAIHVDHGLHADSAEWSDACAALARTWAVTCDRVAVTAGAAPGESPEAAARTARYTAMRVRLQPGEVLLTAHHADDQLETILLQWLRGGGLRAVAGMDRLARFGDASWLARPLLDFTRDDLRAWAVW